MVPKPSKLSFNLSTQVKLNLYKTMRNKKHIMLKVVGCAPGYNLSNLGWNRASRDLHLHFSDEGKIQCEHMHALCSLVS